MEFYDIVSSLEFSSKLWWLEDYHSTLLTPCLSFVSILNLALVFPCQTIKRLFIFAGLCVYVIMRLCVSYCLCVACFQKFILKNVFKNSFCACMSFFFYISWIIYCTSLSIFICDSWYYLVVLIKLIFKSFFKQVFKINFQNFQNAFILKVVMCASKILFDFDLSISYIFKETLNWFWKGENLYFKMIYILDCHRFHQLRGRNFILVKIYKNSPISFC